MFVINNILCHHIYDSNYCPMKLSRSHLSQTLYALFKAHGQLAVTGGGGVIYSVLHTYMNVILHCTISAFTSTICPNLDTLCTTMPCTTMRQQFGVDLVLDTSF